jgi:hypothetical protein
MRTWTQNTVYISGILAKKINTKVFIQLPNWDRAHQAERTDSPVSANPSEPSELLASAQ